jgi:hypothetical protein
MKVRIAVLVLTGVLCAAAPAWSDTISVHSRDSATVTCDASQADVHNAHPVVVALLSQTDDIADADFVPRHANHRFWEDWWHHHKFAADPPPPTPTPAPTTSPVSAPEPPSLELLALGLIGLLGSALFVSPPRSRGL